MADVIAVDDDDVQVALRQFVGGGGADDHDVSSLRV